MAVIDSIPGYSLSSPVTPNNSKRKAFYNSNSNRRNSTSFPHESMNRNSTPRVQNLTHKSSNSSKVQKSKTRLKSTFQTKDRQMFLTNYVRPQNVESKLVQSHNRQSLYSTTTRGINGYSHDNDNLVYHRNHTRYENNHSENLLTNIIKASGLTALQTSDKISFSPIPSKYSNLISQAPSVRFPNEERKVEVKIEPQNSKIGQISKSWKLPEQSIIFKQSIQNYTDTKPNASIYPDRNAHLVNNHAANQRENELAHKINDLNVRKLERKSLTESVKSFFNFKIFSRFDLGSTFRHFRPFRTHDHEVSPEAEVERKDLLVPFTDDMERELSDIFHAANQMICTAFSINIHTKDLVTLLGSNWLNDSVIEFYLNLIASRSESPDYPSVYTFGTFFFTRLSKGSSLGRWANKLDFFSYDILLVPIHAASHWRLAIVDNGKKRIEYYDSLGGEFRQCIDLLAKFLQDESLNKKKEKLDMSEWELNYRIPEIPLQNNSYDCGVFTCKYADYLSRRSAITFTQENIPYFRKCMIYEIIHKKLLN